MFIVIAILGMTAAFFLPTARGETMAAPALGLDRMVERLPTTQAQKTELAREEARFVKNLNDGVISLYREGSAQDRRSPSERDRCHGCKSAAGMECYGKCNE